jgi:hypothetical protein
LSKKGKNPMLNIGIRLLGSVLCAFCLCTVGWIVWGILTPGDYFANGSVMVKPSLLLAGLIGLVVGFRASGRWRILTLVVSIASLCFWIFVPEGWWAKAPPRISQEIPPGVKYKPAPNAVNVAAKVKLEKALANGAVFPGDLPDKHAVMCGPMLWKFLKPSADKRLLQATFIIMNVRTREGLIVTEGRRLLGEEELQSFWKTLMTNFPALQTGNVRKPTTREISYFWATSFLDIDEPFFAIDAGSQTFVAHIGQEETGLYTFDLVGDLRDLKGTAPEGLDVTK